jgi:hypothetical protein
MGRLTEGRVIAAASSAKERLVAGVQALARFFASSGLATAENQFSGERERKNHEFVDSIQNENFTQKEID